MTHTIAPGELPAVSLWAGSKVLGAVICWFQSKEQQLLKDRMMQACSQSVHAKEREKQASADYVARVTLACHECVSSGSLSCRLQQQQYCWCCVDSLDLH